MIFAELNQNITFTFYFALTQMNVVSGTTDLMQDVNGVAGLTVTVTVYSPAGAALVTSAAATDKGNGLYEYTLAANNVTTLGYYRAVATTTSTSVDSQEQVDFVNVITGYATSGAYAGELDDTLDGLARILRVRLNDTDAGNYSVEEIQYCINLAYRETVVSSLCHKSRNTIALVQGTHTYDCTTIFEPTVVYKGTSELDKKQLGDLGINIESWDSTAQGTPTTWMPLTGSQIRIYPTPALNPGSIVVYGYAYPTPLSSATDRATAVQDGYSVQAILDRAEAEARKLRITTGNNSVLYDRLLDQWKSWCQKSRNSVRGQD